MLVVEGLEKRFGRFVAVRDVSFKVARGEVLGFLGPNGAGKTTTMRMIAGALEPDRGRALIDGADVTQARRAAQAKLGYLPEGAPAYADMTPLSFLQFLGRMRGFSGREALARSLNVSEMVGLAEVAYQPIETLSKGYKRRVGLAGALVHDPAVLVLDEPTDGLDPNQKHAVRRLIREIAPQKAILVSTHILEEVDAVCTRAIVFAHGQVLADDTPQGLSRRDPSGRLDAVFRELTQGRAPE